MDLHEPVRVPDTELPEKTLNDAPAAAADDAVNAPATEAVAEPEAEMEVELIMAEGEQEAESLRVDTAETLLEAAEALLASDAAEISADDIRRLRQRFSMLHKPATEDAAEGGEAEKTFEPDETAVRFAEAIERLRAKKAEWTAAQEALRAANLERKNAIIAEIVALADDTDNVNRTFPRYRELQDEFNAVGEVDPTEDTAVWKRYQEARERYSDNLKINKELRDYDFKKNLAEKEVLLAEAIGLAESEDVIAAYRRLQDLHNKWRQIGPVAKELRDDIWNRFRDASAEVNKRYQAYFEARKAREAENEAAKTAL